MSRITARRVEGSKIKQMRSLLISTRVFAGVVSLISFILVISSIETSIWNFQSFWYGMKFFIFLFELLFLILGYGVALLLGWGDSGAVAIMSAIHNVIFGGNETIPGFNEELGYNPALGYQRTFGVFGILAIILLLSLFFLPVKGSSLSSIRRIPFGRT